MNKSQRRYLMEILSHPFPTMGFAPMLEDFCDQAKSLAKSLNSTDDISDNDFSEIMRLIRYTKNTWDAKPIMEFFEGLVND